MPPSACTSPLVCVGLTALDAGVTPGTCGPIGDVGTPCAEYPAQVNGCLGGLVCVGGACAIPPSSGPCAADLYTPCNPVTSYCDTTSDTCQPYKANGVTCEDGPGYAQDCLSQTCGSNGQCGCCAE